MADDDVIRILGAGLSGLAAATILAKNGKKVEVYETRQDSERDSMEIFRASKIGPHQRTSLKKWSNGGWTQIHSNQPISQRWH